MTDKNSQTTRAERYLWELYLLIGGVIALTALVLLGNLPRLAAWLLALLAFGIGQALIFPRNISFLGGLLAVVLWVTLRQVTGIWTPESMPQNLLEMVGLSLNIFLAIRFRLIWQNQQDELQELRALKQVMVAEDAGAGLLPSKIADLRIMEELDRARQFHRPLGLLFIEISPLAEATMNEKEFEQIFTAVARQVASASLVHDIPFRQSATRVGLILPERKWEELYRDADLIATSLSQVTYMDQEEHPQSIRDYVALRFGLGTYQGETTGDVNLVQAAEDSLAISHDLAEMGAAPVSAYAMPATPVIESKQTLEEE